MLHHTEHIIIQYKCHKMKHLECEVKCIYIPSITTAILKLQDQVKILLSVLKLVIAHLII